MNREPSKLKEIVSAIAKYRHSPATLIVILATTVATLACAWGWVSDHAVRFNSYRTGRAFYRLPPLPIMYDQKTGKELSVKEVQDVYWDEFPEDESKDSLAETEEKAWDEAQIVVKGGDMRRAKTALSEFLELTAAPVDYDDTERQAWRNSATDMLDGMSALGTSTAQAVKAYLHARFEYDDQATPERIHELMQQAEADWRLADNWEYLRAAALYKANQKEAALNSFTGHANKYPRSEKNEAALYMIAKLTMESSYSFGKLECGIEGKTTWGDEPVASEPTKKCRDENWHAALDAFQQLMRKYPSGRYVNDVRGWIAYLHRRGGERPQALAEYYRLLGHPTDWISRIEAKRSLQFMGHEEDDETLDALEKLITDDVNAAMAYAYHRVYNHAIDLTYQEKDSWCCYGENRWQQEAEESKRVEDANNAGKHELERIAKFATAMMKRHPETRVSGGFVLRVAEAQLELQNFKDASTMAAKALTLGVEGELRTQALWVKGSSEHRLKALKSARNTFKQLVAEFPKAKLTEGARRLLAMTAEDQDDLETALDLYMDLNYERDVAYFIDVLLPTDRLAKFVENRKNIPQYDQLLYALGVRYMRDKRWSEARETLRRVRTENGTDGYLQQDKNATWYFPKEPGFDDAEFSYIKTSWVMQDLKTIDTLEYHERAVEGVQGDEAKAEAMYQLASCLFEGDDLLFYNPSVWKGVRSSSLSELQFTEHERLPNESRIIFDHLQAHDPWARAIPIYQEIADRFPHTSVARDALYSAAVAHERLSDRNAPWTAAYERGLFAGPRMISYADVKSAYPDYQLPRGTDGWEPSTRTVNGGPGWAAPPKPLPRETREHKIKRLLTEFKGELSSLSTKLSTKVQTKVDAGMGWYTSRLEAAMYGILSGIGLWVLILIGVGLHSQRFRSQLLPEPNEPSNADSRVDKMIG